MDTPGRAAADIAATKSLPSALLDSGDHIQQVSVGGSEPPSESKTRTVEAAISALHAVRAAMAAEREQHKCLLAKHEGTNAELTVLQQRFSDLTAEVERLRPIEHAYVSIANELATTTAQVGQLAITTRTWVEIFLSGSLRPLYVFLSLSCSPHFPLNIYTYFFADPIYGNP